MTMFALTFLAYNFKFLWAPLVDNVLHPAARPLRPAPLVDVGGPACWSWPPSPSSGASIQQEAP